MSTARAAARLRGLYAITSERICADPERLADAVAAALRGGAALVQYRDKWNDARVREANAAALVALCAAHGAALIVNDDVALARSVGAAGVHLGAADASLVHARRELGADAILGATCGNRLERARAAAEAGADYVAFGRFFPSRTKPDAPPATPELLRQARGLRVPLCAIGGVDATNAGALVAAGASLVACVEAVFGAHDIEAAARAISRLFDAAGA